MVITAETYTSVLAKVYPKGALKSIKYYNREIILRFMQFIPEIEQQSPEAQARYQAARLQELLSYLKANAPYYRKVFASCNIDISSVKTVADLVKIPRTSKKDLQENNNDFLCIPRENIREYTATSGTLGDPVTIALSDKDLERLAYNEFLSFSCMEEGNTYQLMLTLDRQFMAGMAYYSGLRKAGKAVIRTGPGIPAIQWDTIQRLQTDTLVAVPSFLLKMIDYARDKNIIPDNTSVRSVLAIGESIRDMDLAPNILAQKIQQEWNIDLYGTYASTEMQTAFTECKAFSGGHHHPELLIVEILDDEGIPVKVGEAGEVTITTLGVEAMPLLRYRTGDICKGYYEPCSCGRQTMRLGPVLGRKQQMLKLKGTTIFPAAIADILHSSDIVEDYAIEAYTNDHGQDGLVLHIHTELPQDTSSNILRPLLQHRLRVLPEIRYHTFQSMQQLHFHGGNRKPLRFIDNRNAQI